MKLVLCVINDIVTPINELGNMIINFAYDKTVQQYVKVLCETSTPDAAQVEVCTDGQVLELFVDLGLQLHPSITQDKYYNWVCKLNGNLITKALKFVDCLGVLPQMSRPLQRAHYIELASYSDEET